MRLQIVSANGTITYRRTFMLYIINILVVLVLVIKIVGPGV